MSDWLECVLLFPKLYLNSQQRDYVRLFALVLNIIIDIIDGVRIVRTLNQSDHWHIKISY